MPACRVTPGFPYTVPASPNPINCILNAAPVGTKISAAATVDAAGKITPLTVNATGQSFALPIATPGLFTVGVVMVGRVSQLVIVAEDCDGKTPLISITDKNGSFDLEVQ